MLPLASPDETLLLARLTDGGEEPFVAMRAQLASARIASRFESAEGVLLEIAVPADAPRVSPIRFELSDVEFTLAEGAGQGFATLRVAGGVVRELELGLDEGDWPMGARIAEVAWTRFVEADDAHEARFERVPGRDREQLRWTLAEQAASGEASGGGADDDSFVPADELAAHPQSTIALPLLVPLAGILDAALDSHDGRTIAKAGTLVAADPRLEGPDALDHVADLGRMILHGLPGLIAPAMAAEWLDVPHADLPLPSMIRRWKAGVVRDAPPPVIAAIAAALLASRWRHGLFDDAARPLTRELFHHARKAGLLTWADAHAHAQAWWREDGSALRVWAMVVRSLAADVDAGEAGEVQRGEPAGTETGPPPAAPVPPPSDHRAARSGEDAREVTALREQLRRKLGELDRARDESRRLTVEAMQARLGRERWRKRAEAQEAENAPLRLENDRLERYARGLQVQLARLRAGADTGRDEPLLEPAETGWPADLLAGLDIVLCTGQDRAGVREAMADALREAGAEVTVYEANGKLPDRFPAGAVVVCEVSFVSHAACDRVRAAAERNDLEVHVLRAGPGGIVRAVAQRCRRLD